MGMETDESSDDSWSLMSPKTASFFILDEQEQQESFKTQFRRGRF